MYVIDQFGKFPLFQINDHIGFDNDVLDDEGNLLEKGDGQGIDGKLFSKEFFETDLLSPEMICVYVNTMGGDVQQSLDIFNAISRIKTKTKGIISGFAYSCGGWLPMACDEVEMVYGSSSWMCHMPYNPTDENKKSDFLEAVLNIISNIISSKSGRNGKPKKTVDEIKKMMKNKTYLNATQMYNEGLIDRITDASGNEISVPQEDSLVYNFETNFKILKVDYKQKQVALNKEFSDKKRKELAKEGEALPDGSFPIQDENDLKNAIHAIGRAKDEAKAKSHIKKRAKELGLESLLPDNWKSNNKNEKQENMKKVINRLRSVNAMRFNLVDDSTEDEVVSSIASMENKINNLSSDKDELEKAVNKAKEDLKSSNETQEEMQKRLKDLQSSKNSMDGEIESLQNKMKNMEAENASLKADKEKADNLAKETKATADLSKAEVLIDGYISTGKIRASNSEELKGVRQGWIEDAVLNYDKTKRQIDAIPVNMAMPVPNFQPDANDKRPDAGNGSIRDFQAINRQERDRKRQLHDEQEKARFRMTN